MKILHLLFSFTTGGTERLLADICNEMVKGEDEIYLYIVNDLCDQTMLDSLSEKVHVQLQKRPAGGGKKAEAIWQLTKYIRQNKIDVIHCNALNASELLILRPLLFPRVKTVQTIHSMHNYDNLSTARIKLRNMLIDQFIAISKSVADDIESHGVPRRKIKIVYNAINLDKFRGVQRNTAKEEFIIGNVARLLPEVKGQDILINALPKVVARHPNVKCLFAGEPGRGKEAELDKLKELAQNLNVENKVEFSGNVDDVPNYLANVDLFVLPSRSEGFGISLVEAMTMGIPCIASNLEGPAEIIGDNERGILFEKENADDLAEKICYVIDTYEEQSAKANANAAYVKTHFDITNMCRELLNIYKK